MSSQPSTIIIEQQGASAFAITGLVFSILGWFTCGLLCIPGAFFCLLALFFKGPKSVPIAGLIIGFPGTIFFGLVGFGMIAAFLGIGAVATTTGASVAASGPIVIPESTVNTEIGIEPGVAPARKIAIDQLLDERTALFEVALAKWQEIHDQKSSLESRLAETQSKLSDFQNSEPAQPVFESREWRAQEGFKTTGTLVTTDDVTVSIKKADGNIADGVRKEILIADDRIYIADAFRKLEAYKTEIAAWGIMRAEIQSEIAELKEQVESANMPQPVPPSREDIKKEVETESLDPLETVADSSSAIPADVTYTVIGETRLPGIKRSVDIRLNKHVSEDTLAAIAKAVRASDGGRYDRTFIGYYLPDMQVDAGYWATTHYNPDLDVRILAFTADAAASLSAKPDATDRDEIGRWLDESPLTGSRIVIVRNDGKLFMELTYQDGSSGSNEIIESQTTLGRRFSKPGGSTTGDHWILDSNGDLQLRDDEGLISTAKKLQ